MMRLTKRDIEFNKIKNNARDVLKKTGVESQGFDFAFLWANVEVGKYTRRILIDSSNCFGNWPEVERAVRQVPGVKTTFLNYD